MKTWMPALILIVLSLNARAAGHDDLIRDSQRRQQLRASAEKMLKAPLVAQAAGLLLSVDGFDLSLEEPRVTLPPDLGGPTKSVQVKVEARLTGWGDVRGDRYDRLSRHERMQCRFHQKMWAQIDKHGKPTRLMPNQKVLAPLVCVNASALPRPDEINPHFPF